MLGFENVLVVVVVVAVVLGALGPCGVGRQWGGGGAVGCF